FTLKAGGLCLAHRIPIFEKLRDQATSSQFQTPSSKEAPSSKLKNRPARRLPRHLFWGFGVLRFGTSLELGRWCLVFPQVVVFEEGQAGRLSYFLISFKAMSS